MINYCDSWDVLMIKIMLGGVHHKRAIHVREGMFVCIFGCIHAHVSSVLCCVDCHFGGVGGCFE